MGGYTKLFSDILTSSIWNADANTRVLWITLLAMSDSTGFVRGVPTSVSILARLPKEETDRCLAILEAPDVESQTEADDGRRLEKVEGGWLILNYEKYRNRLSETEEAISARERQRKRRGLLKKCDANVTSVTSRDTASASVLSSSSPKGESEGDFWAKLKGIYTWLDLDVEKARMEGWLLVHRGRKLTEKFAVNWCNKCDKPISKPSTAADPLIHDYAKQLYMQIKQGISTANLLRGIADKIGQKQLDLVKRRVDMWLNNKGSFEKENQ